MGGRAMARGRGVLRLTGVTGIAVAALLAALACGGRSESQDPATRAGRELYRSLGCGGCHGPAREGRRAAPALQDLAQHWSEESLIAYLEDPDRIKAESPRLRMLAERYTVHMPRARSSDENELLTLVGFLLGG